jgi:serine/threonine protein kinase/Tfp pilus assembly protein PilF
MSFDPARLEEIFGAAVTRPDLASRAAYLDAACGSDAELRARVGALLAAHDAAGDFLKLPGADANQATSALVSEAPGAVIGHYKLLEQIGEGGFAVVFMAQQSEPVRRRVALKIIKLGMDTRQIVARFEAERQALAMMDHPSIAKVFDAGATGPASGCPGRPYFVMELVAGDPITAYCDEHNFSIEQRLALFQQVCQAVQHAHQKGVIHRDIKPSNVLVSTQDGRPLAKVIDFGIAKATQTPLTDKTLFTDFRQLIGTPAYMSPEQAEGSLDIDTRSDVYSLGVLLYELLAGSPPFDPKELRSKPFAEMQRIIREVEPPAPSSRLSTLAADMQTTKAAQRRSDPRRLSQLMRGELDWIVMRALEKDRSRRYQTASALADDIGRYLADEPVSAAAPSRLYRFSKFVQRNKLLVGGTAGFLAVLIAGIAGTTLGLIGQSRQRGIAEKQREIALKQRAKAEAQEQEAKTSAAIAHAVNDFLSDMLTSASPEELGQDATVLQTIDLTVKELDAGKLSGEPVVEANVRHSIGIVLAGLDRMEDAARNFQRAVDIKRQIAPRHPALASELITLAGVLSTLGRFDEAESLLNEGIALQRAVLQADDPELGKGLTTLVELLHGKREFAKAKPILREAIALRANDETDSRGKVILANLLMDQGEHAEAEELFRKALKRLRAELPPKHPLIGNCLNGLGTVLHETGKLDEAEDCYRESMECALETLPAGHQYIAVAQFNYGNLLRERGKMAEAEVALKEALSTLRAALPSGHPDLAHYLYHLSLVLEAQGKSAEAEAANREALQILTAALPDDRRRAGMARAALGLALMRQSKYDDAEPQFRQAIADFDSLGNAQVRGGEARRRHGEVLARLNRQDEAEAELLLAERMLADAPDAPAVLHDTSVGALVTFYSDREKAEPGKGHGEKARQWQARLPEKQKEPAAAAPVEDAASRPQRTAPSP